MAQGEQENRTNYTKEISIDDVLIKVIALIKYLKRNWLILLSFGIVGGLIGFINAKLKKPTYTAVCTFVLEDGKSSAAGQYAGLASIAGISIGGGGGGIFQGDNIMELYKSRTMIEKALLSTCSFNGKKQLLIDRFINYYDLRSKQKDDDKIGWIDFSGNPDNFNRKQNGVITSLVELFNNKILTVDKLDKRLNIISVAVVTKDELFSKCFTEKLVQTVNDFYIQTKTKKTAQTVDILQRQADSLRTILYKSIHGVATANDADPNANPLMSTLREASQKKQVDLQANTAIYTSMVQNLEMAKLSLREEMPLIQVIDKPVLPLLINKVSEIKAFIIGMFIGLFFALTGIGIQLGYRKAKQKKIFSN